MSGDGENPKTQIAKLERKIEYLKEKIDDLEAKRESQDIIIEALISQAKVARKKPGKPRNEGAARVKRPKVGPKDSSTDVDLYKTFPISGDVYCESNGTEETSSAAGGRVVPDYVGKERINQNAVLDQADDLPTNLVLEAEGLVRQIKDIFHPKSKTVDLKINYSFKRFVEYAESSYEFSLTNKKISKPKNPLKLYIEANLDKVIKYIMDNVNSLNLNQMCSTLFMINAEIEYKHKLIIAHDLLLVLESSSKILYIFSALFNNLELREDEFSLHIKKILYHQYCIDIDIYNDDTVIAYLELIKNNFSLQRPNVSLWESPRRFLVNESIFSFSKALGKAKVRCEYIEKGFMLRMLCHYMDWDFTYNQFIIIHLFPPLLNERSPVLVYYVGILVMNAYRVFGKDESVVSIFRELLNLMGDDSDTSIVCYLILKQTFEADCARWFENNQETLAERGFDTENLGNLLLF